MNLIFNLILGSVFQIIAIGIILYAAIWVYRDAKKNNLSNPKLWTLAVLFSLIPNLIFYFWKKHIEISNNYKKSLGTRILLTISVCISFLPIALLVISFGSVVYLIKNSDLKKNPSNKLTGSPAIQFKNTKKLNSNELPGPQRQIATYHYKQNELLFCTEVVTGKPLNQINDECKKLGYGIACVIKENLKCSERNSSYSCQQNTTTPSNSEIVKFIRYTNHAIEKELQLSLEKCVVAK